MAHFTVNEQVENDPTAFCCR